VSRGRDKGSKWGRACCRENFVPGNVKSSRFQSGPGTKLSLCGLRPALRCAREVVTKNQLSASRRQLIAERAWAMRHALTLSEAAL